MGFSGLLIWIKKSSDGSFGQSRGVTAIHSCTVQSARTSEERFRFFFVYNVYLQHIQWVGGSLLNCLLMM
uniref:Protein Malvolio n=1 Tax=Parascaris univalens TaxID=6257 RepID=A0A914ZJ98_PARUN